MQIPKQWLEDFRTRISNLEMTTLLKSPVLIFITCITLQNRKHLTRKSLVSSDRLTLSLASIQWSNKVFLEQLMMKSQFLMKNCKKTSKRVTSSLEMIQICTILLTTQLVSQWKKEDIDLLHRCLIKALFPQLRLEEEGSSAKPRLSSPTLRKISCKKTMSC